jgi:hypothetical protein
MFLKVYRDMIGEKVGSVPAAMQGIIDFFKYLRPQKAKGGPIIKGLVG